MEILNNEYHSWQSKNPSYWNAHTYVHLVNQTATLADQKRKITQLETILRNQENTLVNQKTEITQMHTTVKEQNTTLENLKTQMAEMHSILVNFTNFYIKNYCPDLQTKKKNKVVLIWITC